MKSPHTRHIEPAVIALRMLLFLFLPCIQLKLLLTDREFSQTFEIGLLLDGCECFCPPWPRNGSFSSGKQSPWMLLKRIAITFPGMRSEASSCRRPKALSAAHLIIFFHDRTIACQVEGAMHSLRITRLTAPITYTSAGGSAPKQHPCKPREGQVVEELPMHGKLPVRKSALSMLLGES